MVLDHCHPGLQLVARHAGEADLQVSVSPCRLGTRVATRAVVGRGPLTVAADRENAVEVGSPYSSGLPSLKVPEAPHRLDYLVEGGELVQDLVGAGS